MNGEPTTSPLSQDPAAKYIDEQLQKARASFKRTRIVSVVLILVVLVYLSFIVYLLRKEYLQPKAAAEIVNLQLVTFVQQNGPQMTKEFKAEIPGLIAGIPDLIVEQLPQIREAIEGRIEDVMIAYCGETASLLGETLDEFLIVNKEAVKQLVEAGQDPEGARILGHQLEIEIRTYLKSTGPDGESVQKKLDAALLELKRVDARLHRLAHGKNLTAQEKKLRHAIALITRAAHAEGRQIILPE